MQKFLLVFEGTGEQQLGRRTNWHQNSIGDRSFMYQYYKRSQINEAFKIYLPGPDVRGSNCGKIFNDAIDYYESAKKYGGALDIALVGYSRGAYIAMSVAKELGEKYNQKVSFMQLFDPVSKDFDNSIPGKQQAVVVPQNVKLCYMAHRSRLVGSRSHLMNYVGDKAENSNMTQYIKKEFHGSHAALGGFPGEAGKFDFPNHGYGDPWDPGKFWDPREFTAWVQVSEFMSLPAKKAGFLGYNLVLEGDKIARSRDLLHIPNKMLSDAEIKTPRYAYMSK